MIPVFDEHGLRVGRVLTDRGTEFCGAQDRDACELALAVEDIDQTRTETRSSRRDGICERFNPGLAISPEI